MAVDSPHFDLPFRLLSTGAAVSEQDTYDDVANCVEAIVRTPYGFRDDAPNFGFPSVELRPMPVISSEIRDVVDAQEPRATILISERPDFYDQLIDRITVEVS